MPRLSVLMSVHNGEPWVPGAIQSVLGQTFADFEFIVVDDGSTDRTAAILDGQVDPRLKALHQPRKGLTFSLNRAVGLATAPLVARMDADDVALPERFSRQIDFLAAHPEVGLLGTGCREISPSGEVLGTISPPVSDDAIRRVLIRANPFVHSSVMMRQATLETAGLYDESLPVAQDYDLWLRMSRITRMANLPEPLMLRRLAPGRVSRARDSARLRVEFGVKWRAVRQGVYPWWCAVFLVKPLAGLALPVPLRERARRVLGKRETSG